MKRERLAPRLVIVIGVLSMGAAIAGFVVTMVLNAFVFDEFDAYGELPIPGSGSVDLPVGEVNITFRTVIPGGGDSGVPVPPLRIRIVPPEGVPDPVLTERQSGSTTVNSDARVRVWIAQVAEEGTYEIETGGDVNGYINPRLAFGYDDSSSWPLYLCAGLFVTGLIELIVGFRWSSRVARRPRPLGPMEFGASTPGPAPTWGAGEPAESLHMSLDGPPQAHGFSYTPSDQGIRIEQIRTLAALRDSGALTQDEFEAEKRRILGS